ncbi:hypothetical protein EV144_11016 [Flavobacterium sp. 270]|uniref:DUF6985 domain-containing protein n=1 Tax=Flavobacterium sp. 270 TaxID=2512114 RepID=UPI001064C80D|nr:hypothetical protein [Flavobacterium sp. 270]TDW44112.1 hypothetical protein EV144_11016 [Flavobacterium sp. 270]
MESKIAGKLKPLDYDPDYFESEPYPIPYFNNKKLKIGFVEALYESYLSGADRVLENFLKLDTSEKFKDSKIVYDYYDEVLLFGYTENLNIKTVEDIWNFVYPSEIIIDSDENGIFYLCVSCGCIWEEEHGLQLVFKEGLTLTRASGHDGAYSD